MKERPILFSGEMVRAILEGHKTQTRRVINPQPFLEQGKDGAKNWWCLDRSRSGYGSQVGNSAWEEGAKPYILHWPYGQPGDRLWVREAFQPLFADGVKFRDADWKTGKGYAIRYVATDGRTEWMDPDDRVTDRCKPGIHMPRWASRLTLELTKVRIEKVQEISGEDIGAEGIKLSGNYRASWRELWNSINAKRGFGWDANPWLWVLEFKRL